MEMKHTWPGWENMGLIGEGSFGRVYRIRREEFGKDYEAALKVITIPASQSDVKAAYEEGMDEESVTQYFRSFVEDIVAEFALMSELKGNSNIVSYEDHMVVQHKDQIGWDILIRMELLTALPDYVKEHPFTESDVVRLGIHMACALELCRKRGIIHRDIKPENIFVSRDGYFKLGDFGVARVAEKTISVMSRKGTYNYMAPEVYKGEEYGYGADIYSLGLVMYRFLNDNRVPFLPPYPQAIQYNDREKALQDRMMGLPVPEPVHGDPRLKEIVLKACAYETAERYGSATELREALEVLQRFSTEDPDGTEEEEQPETVDLTDGTGKQEVAADGAYERKPEETGGGGESAEEEADVPVAEQYGMARAESAKGEAGILTEYKEKEEGTEPEIQSEPEPEAGTEPEPGTEAEAGTEPEPGTEAEAGTEPEPRTEPEPGIEPGTEPDTELKTEPEPGTSGSGKGLWFWPHTRNILLIAAFLLGTLLFSWNTLYNMGDIIEEYMHSQNAFYAFREGFNVMLCTILPFLFGGYIWRKGFGNNGAEKAGKRIMIWRILAPVLVVALGLFYGINDFLMAWLAAIGGFLYNPVVVLGVLAVLGAWILLRIGKKRGLTKKRYFGCTVPVLVTAAWGLLAFDYVEWGTRRLYIRIGWINVSFFIHDAPGDTPAALFSAFLTVLFIGLVLLGSGRLWVSKWKGARWAEGALLVLTVVLSSFIIGAVIRTGYDMRYLAVAVIAGMLLGVAALFGCCKLAGILRQNRGKRM